MKFYTLNDIWSDAAAAKAKQDAANVALVSSAATMVKKTDPATDPLHPAVPWSNTAKAAAVGVGILGVIGLVAIFKKLG